MSKTISIGLLLVTASTVAAHRPGTSSLKQPLTPVDNTVLADMNGPSPQSRFTEAPRPFARDYRAVIRHPQVEAYFHRYMDTAAFQGTVLIAKGDSVIHHAAYGLFDIEHQIPNRIDTRFQIGSLTKSFTAVAVMKLVEQGKINLRRPVSEYVPQLSPAIARGLLVHHLLKLQAGLPQNIELLAPVEIMDISPAELLTIINKAQPSFAPGDRYQYSNLCYNLLAMVIEQASGMTYASFLQEYVFKPLGMRQSGIERLIDPPTGRAIGYRNVNNRIRRVQNSVSYALGSGDIYSTAFDIFQWGLGLQHRNFLQAQSTRLLFQGENEERGYYGYGFRIQPYHRAGDHEPGTLIRHGGTMNGFISNYHYYRDDDLTVIVLSNYRDVAIRRITYQLKELLLGYAPASRPNTFKE